MRVEYIFYTKYILVSERDRDSIFSYDSHNDKDKEDWKRNYDKLLIIQLCIY